MEERTKVRWLIILNPLAGSGRGQRDKSKICKILDKAGLEYNLECSEYPKHIIELTIRAIENGCRNLIVAGGDGSLNEAVNGIFTQKACHPEEITVGMIPVGTGNDWIKTFGIPPDYKKAVKIIRDNQTMYQDVGCITYKEAENTKTNYFANMAGFGFDAFVAHQTNSLKNNGWRGTTLYFLALVTSFIKYKTAPIKIILDNKDIEEQIFSVSVGIGRFNGGGIMQAPHAVPDNGYFHVTVINKIGICGILRNLGRLYSGKFVNDHRVSIFQSRSISIVTPETVAGEADGESFEDSKFDIHILLKKLRVIYNPSKYLT